MTNDKKLTSISKFLSLVLRHEPQRIGLELDAAGWTEVDDLLAKCSLAGRPIDRDTLLQVVETSDKQRFALSADQSRIRANQGHSIDVALGLEPRDPPPVLYHGTARRSLESILRTGLNRGERHHVHLTEMLTTARAVGQRYGEPVLLQIDAARMHAQGHHFYCSDNQVWLCDAVPVRYIEVLP
jgi:putative RNA 2'-phosphotransferase